MLLKNKLDKIGTIISRDNVLTTLEERYCYATDASNLDKKVKVPDLVVFVETVEDVQKVLEYANRHEIPVIPRGAGTNMVGACVCTNGGIVLNFSKMNKILDINKTNMTIKVQPGVVLGDLKQKAEEIGLFFPPDPSNYLVSTIGGAIAQSSGGAKAFKYGTTKDYIVSLKVVTADGKLMKLGSDTIKDSVGYHLGQLIVGSEGTLAIVVEATLKLIPKPEASKTIVGYFSDFRQAIEAVNEITINNIYPAAIDFLDNNSIKTIEDYMHCGLNKNAEYMILIELDGLTKTLELQQNIIVDILKNFACSEYEVTETDERAELLWKARHSSYAASAKLAPDIVSDDIIVPKDRLVDIIEFCKETYDKYDLKMCMVGHVGDGNLHPQIALNLENDDEFRSYMKAKSEIYKRVVELGGTISAEHGVGLEKMNFIAETLDSQALEYMRLIKKIFDPKGILNPGKIFD